MRIKIDSYRILARNLKSEYPKMSDFEILSLAIQIERNQILENGLNVSTNDKSPSALEAISIALGYDDSQFKTTITDVLKDIVNK